MPRHRSTRRSIGSTIRRATNQYWIDANGLVTLTVVGGTPQLVDLLNNNLSTDYQAKPKGATVLSVRGSMAAYATTTAAAGDSTLTAGIMVQAPGAAIAALDPTTTAGRVQPWMWQTDWLWPITTPAAIASNVNEVRREVNVRSRRIIPSNDQSLLLVIGASPTASVQTWQFRYHLRTLLRVP